MSQPTGTVQRWDAYVQTAVAEPYVEWIKDAEGGVVTYDDHKAAMDALAAQAVALAEIIIIMKKHGIVEMGEAYRIAQAILDAQGRKG